MKKILFFIIVAYFSLGAIKAQIIVNIPISATEPYLGSHAKGTIRIVYANAATLTRPLIVTEGFDAGHILEPEKPFGLATIDGFINDAINDGGNLESVLFGPTSQYDIVYIDWANGTDYIQRNALLVEQVIRYVNANKVAVGGVIQPNVVLGQSMGGLCARYALRDMENKGENHQTRLYVSWDSPHQGANVPEGYQRLARHARDLYILTGGTAVAIEAIQLFAGGLSPLQALNIANQPAARQMLVNRVNDMNAIDNTDHNTWQTELKNMGYPQGVAGIPFKRLAISNGSECAKPQAFNAGDNLFTYQGNLGSTTILGEIAASMTLPIAGAVTTQPLIAGLGILPGRNQFNFDFLINAKADGIANQVYKGKITFTKKVLGIIPVTAIITNRSFNSAAATLPYDYFPGGYYDLSNLGLNLQSSSGPNNWVNYFYQYNITAHNQPTFNFVPTASALDIGSGNVVLTKTDYLTPYVGGNPPIGTKASPFQNFVTAFNGSPDNESHILIERRNGDWFAAELNGNSPTANCSIVCGVSIAGPDAICDNGVFSVPLIGGATYVWQVISNGVLVTAVPNNNTLNISRRRPGNGNVTISVQIITNDCGTTTVNKTFQYGNTPSIVTGPYDINQHTIMGVAYTNTQYYFKATESSTAFPASNYTWTLFPPTGNPTLYGGSTIYVTCVETGIHTLQVEKTTVCGTVTSQITFNVEQNLAGFSMAIAPNPVTDQTVNILISDETSEVASLSPDGKTMVELFSFNFAKKEKQWTFNNSSKAFKLNLAGLAKGTYVLKITKGDYQQTKQIIIK